MYARNYKCSVHSLYTETAGKMAMADIIDNMLRAPEV